ncbi:MAG: AarF/ABC1/UbiB kinase family protein [Candidatus Margulisbacteria bacterium]|nr:AarF/ABC1/UbiB kinase family protein [Candidatus Margulisiibacteriota bacterium]
MLSTNDKLPLSKSKRIGIFAKSALKIAAKHTAHSVSKTIGLSSKEEALHLTEVAQEAFKSLSKLRGTALKAAQLLSQETPFLPPEIKAVFGQACYQAPALNRAVVRKVILTDFKVEPETLFSEFNTHAFAAASIGQVHKGKTKEGQSIAIKIQYPGIRNTIESDMEILDLLLLKLPLPGIEKQRAFFKTSLKELKTRFIEECDYQQEAAHATLFSQTNFDPNIVISRPLAALCSDSVLTTTFLDGLPLEAWLKTQPSQTHRNQIGQLIWNFFISNFIKNGLFHADPNPGNYLVLSDNRLGVVDFGCIKKVAPSFPKELQTVLNAHLNLDIKPVLSIYTKWGIIPKDTAQDPATLEAAIHPFRTWLTLPFQDETFDFNEHSDYIGTRFIESLKTAMTAVENTTSDFVMFDRTYVGIMSLLIKLKAKVRMRNLIKF